MTRRTVTVSAVGSQALQLKVVGQCTGCSAAGCSSRFFDRESNSGVLQLPLEYIRAPVPAGIVPGDQIDIAIQPHRLVLFTLAVFLLPILLMLLSCVTCGALLSQSNGPMTVAAAAGLAAGGGLAKLLVNRYATGEDRALLNIVTASVEAR